MLKKAAVSGVGLFLLASPVFASADQVSDLMAQVQLLLARIQQLKGQTSVNNFGSICFAPTRNLSVDDTDLDTNGEVTKLQRFLAQDPSVYPEGRVTGYFGPATMRAVQRWQRVRGIVSSGDPDSTGYGFVGVRTRAAMAGECYTVQMPKSEDLTTARMKGRDARRVSDIKQLQLALELYYNDHNVYPPTLTPLASQYISTMPKDPTTNAPYSYAAIGSACTGYHIGATLETVGNIALQYDADAMPNWILCAGSTADFSGTDPMYDVEEVPATALPVPNYVPTIYSISPAQSSGKDVDLVTLTGKNFVYTNSNGKGGLFRIDILQNGEIKGILNTLDIPMRVFTGAYLTPPDTTGSRAQFQFPNTMPAGTYQLRVVTDLGPSNTVDYTVGFALQPVITSTGAKAAGNFEVDAGGEVSIYGMNLATVDSTHVYIGGIQATVTWTSESMVSARVPSSLTPGQSYDLYIVNQYGTSNIVRVKVLSNLTTSQPSIAITSPANVSVRRNTLLTWAWSSFGSMPTVDIYLLNGGATQMIFATAYQNVGSFSWTAGYSNSGNQDIANGYYTIVTCPSGQMPSSPQCGRFNINLYGNTPVIGIAYPLGGEAFRIGGTMFVSFSGPQAGDQYTIDLFQPAKGSDIIYNLGTVIAQATDMSKNSFTVPYNVPAGTYQARVMQLTNQGVPCVNVCAMAESNHFTITTP